MNRHVLPFDPVSAEKGEYRHFMQKEIHEQVRSLTDTLAGRVDFDSGMIFLDTLNLDAAKASSIKKIIITACGTASHAGMVGKILDREALPAFPTEVLIASEFRYSDPIVDQYRSSLPSASQEKRQIRWQPWKKVAKGAPPSGRS